MFQVVPPCGGHPAHRLRRRGRSRFQVVPPCGGHPRRPHQSQNAWGFKSCPRVGGITSRARAPSSYWKFQVVPPCGGHLPQVGDVLRDVLVSSRAPVWGASPGDDTDEPASTVSSRAPVWGASWWCRVPEKQKHVSSRAPVWGASLIPYIESVTNLFQVVPPCGGHRACRRGPGTPHSFKSCPRVGGIAQLSNLHQLVAVSSRAPVWGASGSWAASFLSTSVSSRAPVWGASLREGIRRAAGSVSSRAPVWGASGKVLKFFSDLKFQVVPPCGGHL